MPTPLIPQEIYLLERYSSKEYFLPVRDGWEAVVRHVERCLQLFMEQLPPDYRSRRLQFQPDIVWGERVLPNFRSTLADLFSAYIRVTHGDLQMLGAASQVRSDNRGAAEFSSAWMDEPAVARVIPDADRKYDELLRAAMAHTGNIECTIRARWAATDLTTRYHESRGPLDPPERWPRYRLNPAVQVKTGEPVPQTGIYLPTVDQGCATLLLKDDEALEAAVLIRIHESFSEDGIKYHEYAVTERRPSHWTLVERVPGEFVDDPLADLLQPDSASVRVERVPAGQPCPRTGWWHTPAKLDSCRRFVEGEVFPTVEGNDYGATFWLWSQK